MQIAAPVKRATRFSPFLSPPLCSPARFLVYSFLYFSLSLDRRGSKKRWTQTLFFQRPPAGGKPTCAVVYSSTYMYPPASTCSPSCIPHPTLNCKVMWKAPKRLAYCAGTASRVENNVIDARMHDSHAWPFFNLLVWHILCEEGVETKEQERELWLVKRQLSSQKPWVLCHHIWVLVKL